MILLYSKYAGRLKWNVFLELLLSGVLVSSVLLKRGEVANGTTPFSTITEVQWPSQTHCNLSNDLSYKYIS